MNITSAPQTPGLKLRMCGGRRSRWWAAATWRTRWAAPRLNLLESWVNKSSACAVAGAGGGGLQRPGGHKSMNVTPAPQTPRLKLRMCGGRRWRRLAAATWRTQ